MATPIFRYRTLALSIGLLCGSVQADTAGQTDDEVTVQGNTEHVTVIGQAARLDKARPIIVDGISHIRYNSAGEAEYHRDYFDMGQMIYDHVPFVRGMVKFVDKRMRKLHDPTTK